MTAFARQFRSMARRRGPARSAAMRRLLESGASWNDWVAALNALHVTDPEREARLAAELVEESDRLGRRRDRALFGLVHARALHRAGSARAAVDAFADAARRLRAAGEPFQALKADVLAVDALGHAGLRGRALGLARRAARHLGGRGREQRLWRAVLDTNRANVLRLDGDLGAALRTYERAARAFHVAGDTAMAAIARTNAGVALLDLGEPRRARACFEAALPVFHRSGERDRALDVRENVACAWAAEGALGASIRLFGELVREHERSRLRRREASCRMDLSEALRRAGDRRSAAQEARRAARGLARAGAQAERAEALWLAALAVDDAAEARFLLREARAAARRSGRPGIALRCEVLAHDGDLRAGRRVSGAALERLARRASDLGHRGVAAEARLLRATLELRRGSAARAHRLLSRRDLRRSARPWIRAAAETGLAQAEVRMGRLGAALARLERGAAFLDAVRSELPGPWLRTSFALERLDPYLARVDLLLERGRPRDRAEAERILDELAARRSLDRERPRGGGRLATLRRRLERVYDRLARGDGARRGLTGAESAELEREARRLERAAGDLWRAAERHGPRRVGLRGARPLGTRARNDTVIVHVWQRDEGLWGLVRQGERVGVRVPLGDAAALEAALERVRFQAERLRLFPGATGTAALLAALDDVRERTLAPLGALAWPSRVRFVLDPRCPDVPWELVPVAPGSPVPLCAERDVLRVPAASVGPVRAPRGRGRAILALGESDLPAIRRELVAAGRRAWRRAGKEADRAALARALGHHELVHVAGHGIDAPEAPGWGGIRLADGWFGPTDVPRRVAARRVLLSACRSGREAGAATQAWGALPATLLGAGARFVAWTASEVDDHVAADVAARFYVYAARGSAATAFGRALADVAARCGHVGGVLPYRMSGWAR
jgi:tetratricopeptide (TPR) repeat protein